jgi:3',5'-cyclic AMP phosphodiesterase CpdA
MTEVDSSPPFRIAHISDLHFSQITWSPSQFFSKRWIGNINLLLRRKREFDPDALLTPLLDTFRKQDIQLVLISGDLSSTSLEAEFLEASSFIDRLRDSHIDVVTLPGNHDHYTKSAFQKKIFYQFFDTHFSSPSLIGEEFSLKEHQVAVKKLPHNWWIVALDTALATPLFSCQGKFSEQIEQNLEKVLSILPEDDFVIVANHFPIFTVDHAQRHLIRDEALKKIFQKWKKVKLYLHGHTHRHSIADLRNANLPILLDSGSTAHKFFGSWNLIECHPKSCEVRPFKWLKTSPDQKEKSWVSESPILFKW